MNYFCASNTRPKFCKIDTNLCCLQCNCKEECYTLHHKIQGVKPCIMDNFEENEICEFLI